MSSRPISNYQTYLPYVTDSSTSTTANSRNIENIPVKKGVFSKLSFRDSQAVDSIILETDPSSRINDECFWMRVADLVKERLHYSFKPSKLKNRYCQYLDPKLDLSEINDQEKKLLPLLVKTYGEKDWDIISLILKEKTHSRLLRPVYVLKNWYYSQKISELAPLSLAAQQHDVCISQSKPHLMRYPFQESYTKHFSNIKLELIPSIVSTQLQVPYRSQPSTYSTHDPQYVGIVPVIPGYYPSSQCRGPEELYNSTTNAIYQNSEASLYEISSTTNITKNSIDLHTSENARNTSPQPPLEYSEQESNALSETILDIPNEVLEALDCTLDITL